MKPLTVYNNTNFFLGQLTGSRYLDPHAQTRDMDGRTMDRTRWTMYTCGTDANLRKKSYPGGRGEVQEKGRAIEQPGISNSSELLILGVM